MSAAYSILNKHNYCPMGGAAAICADARGWPTDCTWKPSRRRGANGMGVQHMQHVADLIDQAYSADLLVAAELTTVRDLVRDQLAMDAALAHVDTEFQRGRRQVLRELANVLNLEETGVEF